MLKSEVAVSFNAKTKICNTTTSAPVLPACPTRKWHHCAENWGFGFEAQLLRLGWVTLLANTLFDCQSKMGPLRTRKAIPWAEEVPRCPFQHLAAHKAPLLLKQSSLRGVGPASFFAWETRGLTRLLLPPLLLRRE